MIRAFHKPRFLSRSSTTLYLGLLALHPYLMYLEASHSEAGLDDAQEGEELEEEARENMADVSSRCVRIRSEALSKLR